MQYRCFADEISSLDTKQTTFIECSRVVYIYTNSQTIGVINFDYNERRDASVAASNQARIQFL